MCNYRTLALEVVDQMIAEDNMNAIMVGVENAKDLHNRHGEDFWEVLYTTIQTNIDSGQDFSEVEDYRLFGLPRRT